ncbi:hypothetical protein [Candidatus Phyllobacterium onerii]|uniref:hypothetical protein n=1 Tax=Candidatus Phyllobacterium onerii TaxID=3020828 RepID=UPI00232C5A19|nr:hypothetical protein [Phyllobacterium sp. IY22]
MFSKLENLIYSTEDWATMQTAHRMASAILNRDPTTHENAERLARCIMKLFDQGMRDAKDIALKAAEQEASVSAIGDERDGGIS